MYADVTSILRPEKNIFLRRSLAHIMLHVIFFLLSLHVGLLAPPPPPPPRLYEKAGYATLVHLAPLWLAIGTSTNLVEKACSNRSATTAPLKYEYMYEI